MRRYWLGMALWGALSGAVRSTESAPAWAATDIAVSETIDGERGRASTRIQSSLSGDARVTVDFTDGHKRNAGTIMLIAGRWMASQGLTLKRGAELDFLDAAALNSQLIQALLQVALPEGPPKTAQTLNVSVAETSRSIKVVTNSASGEYGVPWAVQGIVTVASPGAAHYELTFQFTNDHRRNTVRLSGDVNNPTPPFVISDDMPLDGWVIHRIAPTASKTPKGTQLDYGAIPRTTALTVRELRAAH